MRKAWIIAAGLAGSVGFFGACGSSNDGTAGACTPGDSKACVGAGGCAGGQVCNSSGTAYGDCDCGSGGGDASAGNDAGSSSDGSSDSGSFTPADVAGLVLWLAGDDVDVDGGAVSRWPDRSGRGHDLLSTAHPPTVHHAAIGGHDAVEFASASLQGLAHPTAETDFGWGADDFVIETVIDFPTNARGLLLALIDGPASHQLNLQVFAGTDTAQDYWGGDNGSAPLTTGSHVVAFRRTGTTTAELRVDGTPTAVTLSASVSNLTTSASILVGGQDPVYTDGDIAEIVVVHNPSNEDVTKLESYLKSKYGL